MHAGYVCSMQPLINPYTRHASALGLYTRAAWLVGSYKTAAKGKHTLLEHGPRQCPKWGSTVARVPPLRVQSADCTLELTAIQK